MLSFSLVINQCMVMCLSALLAVTVPLPSSSMRTKEFLPALAKTLQQTNMCPEKVDKSPPML